MAEPERFIFLETDFHAQKSLSRALGIAGNRGASTDIKPTGTAIRRPYRGIEIKEDTYATLSIIDGNDQFIKLTSSSAPIGNPGAVDEYSDFILNRIEMRRTEKQQIVETFGDSFVFFFGERPTVITLSGVLINTADFNWRSQFWENWEQKIRGSKLVQRNARAYLAYDTMVIEGYPLDASAADDAEMPYAVPFTMQMLVTNFHDYSNIGSTLYPGQTADYEALNSDLESTREQFVSTTMAARLAALEAGGGGGGAMLREALRDVNSAFSLVSGDLARLKTALMGRVVRVPVGVAGSVIAAGEAEFASGSVVGAGIGTLDARATGPAPSSSFLLKQFDAATGTLKTVTGSVKVRAPALAKFAPIGPKFRSRFSDNTDEYPRSLFGQGRHLADLIQELGGEFSANLVKRQEERTARDMAQSKALEALKITTETEGEVFQGVATAVQFLRAGFALGYKSVKAAQSVVESGDPNKQAVDLLLSSLGLDGIESILTGPAVTL